MMNLDPESMKKVLLTQIQSVEARLLSTYPNNGLINQLETGTRSNGNGTVEAYLSYLPNSEIYKGSIDLTFALNCKENDVIFSSTFTWSDGKMIDEVVVCKTCPDCPDELVEMVEGVVGRTLESLVNHIVDQLEKFCQGKRWLRDRSSFSFDNPLRRF